MLQLTLFGKNMGGPNNYVHAPFPNDPPINWKDVQMVLNKLSIRLTATLNSNSKWNPTSSIYLPNSRKCIEANALFSAKTHRVHIHYIELLHRWETFFARPFVNVYNFHIVFPSLTWKCECKKKRKKKNKCMFPKALNISRTVSYLF